MLSCSSCVGARSTELLAKLSGALEQKPVTEFLYIFYRNALHSGEWAQLGCTWEQSVNYWEQSVNYFEVTMLDRVFVTMQSSAALRESSWIFWCYNPQEVFCFCFFGNYMQNSAALRNNGREFFWSCNAQECFCLTVCRTQRHLGNSPWLNFFNCSPQLSLFYNWNAFWQHLGTVRKFFWSYKSLFYSCMQVQLH